MNNRPGLKHALNGILTNVRRLGLKLGITVTDQFIFSVTTFIANLLLARWLPLDTYGVFAIGFAVLLFLSGFHNALVLEPMSVFGASSEARRFGAYLTEIIWLHIGLTAALALATILAIPFVTNEILARTLFGVSFSLPFILLMWVVRRAFYIQSNPAFALLLSIIYCGSTIFGLGILHYYDTITPISVFLLLAGSSFISSMLMWPRLGLPGPALSPAYIRSLWAGPLRQHWRYGRWALGTTTVRSVGAAIYLPLIGYLVGLDAAGGFRAIQNLFTPIQQIISGFGLLLLPWTAARYRDMSRSRLIHVVLMLSGQFAGLAILYFLVLSSVRTWVVTVLYSQPEYLAFLWLTPYLGGAVIISALSASLVIPLRAAERPNAEFWSQSGNTCFTLTVGIYLGVAFGLQGLAVSLVTSMTLAAAILLVFISRLVRDKSKHAGPTGPSYVSGGL